MRFPKLAAFALGLISATGFAPLGLWPVTLVALAMLMNLVVRAVTTRAALARGYWFGVGHFAVGLNWIAGSFRYQETMPVWLGWVAVVGLSLYLALYPMLAAGAAWRWGRSNAPFVLLFAAFWIVTEWLRATMFTGFAWNPLGVMLVDIAGVSQYIGTYGFSGLVCLLAGVIALGANRAWKGAALLGLPVLIVFGLGVSSQLDGSVNDSINSKAIARPPRPLLRVVQPNIGQQDKHDASFDAVNFAKLESLTGKPGAVPRLILWPEAAIPDYLEEEEWARARVASLLGPKDLLLTGGTALDYSAKGHLVSARNGVFAVTPDAKIAGSYAKAHLVPGGEYLPMRWLMEPLGATRLVPGDIDFKPGPGARSLDLTRQGFGEIGIQICYEIIFSGRVVDPRPYARPTFIFNPSNDAWFGSWGPPQHLAQARLRAIEEGLPVVRATPTGISAIIDSNGQVLRALPYRKPGYIEARLPPAHTPTFFGRYGNKVPLALAFLLSLIGIALRRRTR